MIEFFISGQNVTLYSPVIAADSLNFLTAKFYFDDNWIDAVKWAHFRIGEELGGTVYDIALNEDDEITADMGLNLTVGEWSVFVTGTIGESRLTTVPAILTVKESGLVDAPLHVMPLSVAEQVDAKASTALLMAQSVKEAADSGMFDGKSFNIIAYYPTLDALRQAVPDPDTGAAYGIGEQSPYDIYIWDSVHAEWVNNGNLQGVPGPEGDAGTTFTPHVDVYGNLTWTNDGGLPNPDARNIRGPEGAPGTRGPEGPSAYSKAVEAGYTGTEATFYAALTYMPYHNARHLPGGADPIVVESGNVKDAAISRAKIAANAVTDYYTATTSATWAGSAPPYTTTATVNGLTTADHPLVGLNASTDYATAANQVNAYQYVYRVAVTAANTLTLYSSVKSNIALPLQIQVSRR